MPGDERQVPDRLRIAQETIVSAGNVMSAAGFGREEIAAFFRQAADQIDGVAMPVPEVGEVSVARSGEASPAGADLRSEFATIPPVLELAARSIDRRTVVAIQTGAERPGTYMEHALSMIPLVAQAQDWLRDMATQADMAVLAHREQRDPAQPEQGALYLEDFETVFAPCFSLVGALVDASVRDGNEQQLTRLLHGLASNGVLVSRNLKERLEESVHLLSGGRGAVSGE